jgi:Fe2+ or Zn2+ uptake regulation protein
LHLSSVVSVSEMIADHPDARLRRSVLEAIDNRGGVASMGQILGRLKMKRRPVLESLDALVEEGRLRRVNCGDGFVYESQVFS